MTRFALLLLLLLPMVARGQDVISVSKMPSPDQVASAKDIIKKAQSDPVVLRANGYALANIDFAQKLKCYPVPGSDDCLKFLPIPKGTAYEGLLVSNSTGELSWTRIEPDKDKDRYLIIGVKQGTSTIIWIANGATPNDEPVVIAAYQFVVGKKPDPGPTPGPGPTPTPVPIPGEGLRVLFVYETKDLSTLPSAQVQSLTAKEVLDYLDSHCIKVDNQPEYRKFDPQTDMSKASEVWQAAMKRPRASLPFLLISNGKTGYEGPLPPNTAELMKLLKQYGGN